VPEPPAPSPVPDTPPPSPSSPPSPAAASVEDQIVSQLESQGGSPDAPAPVTFKIARGKDFAMEGTYQLAFSDGRQYPIYKNTSPGSLGEWRVDGLNNGISGVTRAELIDKLKTLDESRPYIDAYTGNPDPRTGGAGTIGDRLRSYRQTHGLSEPSAGVSTVMGEELLPGRGPKPGPRAAPAPAAETATPELPDAWKDLTTDPKGGTDISFMGTGIAKNVLARLVTRFGADQLKALGWLQPVTPTTPTKPFSGISGAQGPGFIRRAPGNIGRGMGGAFIARDKETEDDALAAELLEELTRQRAAGTL
jgi:hypothetical protein